MNKIKEIKDKYCREYSSAHYDFYFSEGSFAQKNIIAIAQNQEKCYKIITSALQIEPDFKIRYLLADTPEDLGVLYGDNEPCNGYARLPNNVYAVYNEQVKCIGMHEDAHIISYSVKRPVSAFMREGLAMYFDVQWQGKSNEECCRNFVKESRLPDVIDYIDNDNFFNAQEALSYPLAGAFAKFLIDTLSMGVYLQNIYYNDNVILALNNLFGGAEKVQSAFSEWLMKG